MALIKCPGCGTEISERAEECPICGRTISKSSRDENMMKCYKCGRLIQRDISICPFCGYHYGTYKNKKMNEPNLERNSFWHRKKKWPIFVVILLLIWVVSKHETNSDNKSNLDQEDIWLDGYTNLDDFDYYINGDDIHIKRYEGNEDKIRVNSSYNGKKVVSFEDATFMFCDAISVVIPEGTKHLDNPTFNSSDIKYIFLPSTLEDVEDEFWGYLHNIEKIYYGGTNEQWNKMCQFGRKGIEANELFCKVDPDDLGTEKSESSPIVMQEVVEKDSKDESDNSSKLEKESLSSKEQFVEDSSKYLSADIANKLYTIITSDLGFEKVEFVGKDNVGDSVWNVYCDDISVLVVASDDVYRIWSGDYTFYEEGTVVTTKQQMNETFVKDEDRTSYYVIAQDIVMQYLKNPTSAKFPWGTDEIGFAKSGNVIAVQGYVDATNSFGGQVRSQWTVEFRVTDLAALSYEILYVNVDGQSSGTYIELN